MLNNDSQWLNKWKLALVTLLLAVLPFGILKFGVPGLSFVQKHFQNAQFSINGVVTSANDSVFGVWDNYLNLVGTKKRSTELEKVNSLLRSELWQLKAQLYEQNTIDSSKQGVKQWGRNSVMARIIGRTSSDYSYYYVINKGAKDGVKIGDPIVSPHSLVGQVIETFNSYSIFNSIHDSNFKIDALNLRSNSNLMVQGGGWELLKLKLNYLDRADDYRIGDQIVTGGLAGVFPKGIPVGRIISVEKPNVGVIQFAELRSEAIIHKMNYVHVLLVKPQSWNQEAGSQ